VMLKIKEGIWGGKIGGLTIRKLKGVCELGGSGKEKEDRAVCGRNCGEVQPKKRKKTRPTTVEGVRRGNGKVKKKKEGGIET